MKQQKLQELVDYVYNAQIGRFEIEKITAALCPGLTIGDAYAVQQALIERMLANGEHILGPKMGLTSEAKLQQMQVADPIYGYTLQSMQVPDGSSIRLRNYIHPKAEPEIGIILKQPLTGPGITAKDVLQAAEFVFPAIEIIDSRYKNFDFTLPDVIADNTSAAGVVLGAPVPFSPDMDMAAMTVALSVNSQTVAMGTGAAVLGHPANSVARLANLLARKGHSVPAGAPILTGGITAAANLAPGDYVEARFDGLLGRAGFHVQCEA